MLLLIALQLFAIKHVDHRAKAIDKKIKVGDSSTAAQIFESQEHVLITPEINPEQPEETQNKQDDLPPQIKARISMAMNVDANPTGHPQPPSPKPSSPAAPINKNPTCDGIDDIVITGLSFKSPEVSRVLTKHSAKEETPLLENGKAKLDLDNYTNFYASELHAGNLSRIHTSRDMEADLVNLMKQNYEVRMHLTPLYLSCINLYPYCPQVISMLETCKNLQSVAPKGWLI